MRFTRLRLENWRNFLTVDVQLQRRVFLVGPNASGKSNVLDALRFLRDIADPQGGGFMAAVTKRGGVSQIRSLHARRNPNVVVDVTLDVNGDHGSGAIGSSSCRTISEFHSSPKNRSGEGARRSSNGRIPKTRVTLAG